MKNIKIGILLVLTAFMIISCDTQNEEIIEDNLDVTLDDVSNNDGSCSV